MRRKLLALGERALIKRAFRSRLWRKARAIAGALTVRAEHGELWVVQRLDGKTRHWLLLAPVAALPASIKGRNPLFELVTELDDSEPDKGVSDVKQTGAPAKQL